MDSVLGYVVTLEIILHDRVVEIGNSLKQSTSVFFGNISHILRDVGLVDNKTLVITVKVGLLLYEVDKTNVRILFTDRQLYRNSICLKSFTEHLYTSEEISSRDVHFVYIGNTRNTVFISLSPNGFRLRFNAALCTEYGNRTVKNSQRSLNLNREVHVPWRIDNIDLLALPACGYSSGCDCNTALLLLLHPVHCSSTVVCFTDLVLFACIEQNSFGSSRFAGIDVRHDTYVSN